ncbi:MAG: TIGR04255 family protein [Acidimicrobiales bacterium]
MGNEEHEMHPSAPVVLVAVEITFPGEIGSPVPSGARRALGEVLGEGWVIEPIGQPRLTLNLGGAQPLPPQPPSFPETTLLRFADRQRGAAIALTAGSVSVETTRYGNWPKFRSTLEMAIRATEKLLHPVGVTRTGIRYIDEVRVGGVEDPQWGEWLSPTVLPPAAQAMVDSGWPPVNWTGGAQYRIGEDRNLVLRFGPQPAQPGFVVNPDGPLRRPGPRPEGPFFLLDFDASWQPPGVPRWDSDILLETCDQLRHPVRALFDQLVTTRLVEQVFKRGSGK